ncbi:YxlC family protein [Sutcliffiella deserti]|uniref:YxlC family protein n=1 Tax=Sutcliffiella deserti TaxID=2875501 RepID=UPI001CBE7670|nr:YxlC family protein [Sutcliffiella deserti]
MSRYKENSKEKLIEKLHKDWKHIDDLASPPSPSNEELKEMLVTAKVEARKAFYKELTIFITSAMIILAFLTTAVFQAPMTFIVVQVLAIIIAPIIFVLLYSRKQEGPTLS